MRVPLPVPVLVVDDEPTIQFTIERVLAAAGYQVSCVDDGSACLAAVRAGFRGVILMDVMMPGLDGWETIAALAEEGLVDGNAICVVTALNEPEAGMAKVKEHIRDFLCKPFQVPELLAKVAELARLVAASAGPPRPGDEA
jgi:CheY-like chemotaxis protein